MGNIFREVNIMLVKDVMSKDIVNLNSNDSVEKAAQMMRQYDVGAIPVCDNSHRLSGIITDRDITLNSVALGDISQAPGLDDNAGVVLNNLTKPGPNNRI